MSEKYEKNVYLAMLAEQCNRFEDMMEFLEDMVKSKKEDLSSDERNLLSIAYKNTVSQRRQAVRTLLAYEIKEKKKPESHYLEYIIEYKKRVEAELAQFCQRVVNDIDNYLLPKATDAEAQVFYYKMKGDYYRYIAENVEGEEKDKNGEYSLNAYSQATELAKSLNYANPIKLGLALNYSVFYYEVKNNQEAACNIARETLDLARKEVADKNEDEDEYKDAFSIINLLQENLNMWTIENEGN